MIENITVTISNSPALTVAATVIAGIPGVDGVDGVGVPAGGTTGQVLGKSSADDFDTEWVDQTGGGGGSALTSYATQVATLPDYPASFQPTIGSTSATAVAGDDARLSDQREPLSHGHVSADISDSQALYPGGWVGRLQQLSATVEITGVIGSGLYGPATPPVLVFTGIGEQGYPEFAGAYGENTWQLVVDPLTVFWQLMHNGYDVGIPYQSVWLSADSNITPPATGYVAQGDAVGDPTATVVAGLAHALHNSRISGTVSFASGTDAAFRVALGATSTGNALFTATDAAAARTAIGATSTGSALITAANAAAAATAAGVGSGNSPTFLPLGVSLATSAPFATVNCAQWVVPSATGSANVSVMVRPKGTGAFFLNDLDYLGAQRNARGSGAVDLQLHAHLNSSISSGLDSFSAGYAVVASGAASAAIGKNLTASGSSSFAAGENNSATGTQSTVPGGSGATAYNAGMSACGGGASNGQRGRLIGGAATTDATPTKISYQANSGYHFALTNNTTWLCRILIVARTNTAGGGFASFERRALISRGASAAFTAIVGAVGTVGTDIGSNAGSPPSGWGVTIGHDVTNGALLLTATGAAATNIRWTAEIELLEQAFA